ncbi:MAG: nuclease [Actinomycetales bacterium]|nr:NERD domain-containing protein [Tetrasphaera sp.]NLW98180.1 nuclease [Actinomycetales bacterium]
MTPRCLPEDPQFTTTSEREVWERLRKQAPAEWTLLANVRLTDERKDHELDLVVLMPDVGIVVLEVKGGAVSIEDGRWWTGLGAQQREIRPVEQARGGKYALREYIEADPRWKHSSRTRVRFGHSIVLPYTDVDDDFATPDCPRWAIHGRGDQGDLAGRLWDIAARQESGHRVPTEDDCDLVVEILRGRNLPQRTLLAEADERESRAERLTVEQAAILSVTRLLNRVEVRGGAGSGKTVLAMTQARQLSRGVHGIPAQRVALICYSIGLAQWFTRILAKVPRRERPAFVGTFEGLARYLGVTEFGGREDRAFWEERLPVQMAELARELPDGKRFDALVIDEAQDFADDWWTPMVRCLRDEEKGGLFAYSDENQRVFARFGRPPFPLVPLVLDQNLRNTKQITEVFVPLAPMRMYARGGDGPEVTFVPCEVGEALDVADDQIDPLIDEGWRPEDIMLLTTGARHPEQVALQESLDQEGYWSTFWDKDLVFYGHVLGCKGLERRVVVLCVNNTSVRDRAKERLYVGLSRATDRLIVVGPPHLVREMGGPEVAARLGI